MYLNCEAVASCLYSRINVDYYMNRVNIKCFETYSCTGSVLTLINSNNNTDGTLSPTMEPTMESTINASLMANNSINDDNVNNSISIICDLSNSCNELIINTQDVTNFELHCITIDSCLGTKIALNNVLYSKVVCYQYESCIIWMYYSLYWICNTK